MTTPAAAAEQAAQRIAHGYDTTAPAVVVGSVVIDQTVDPTALVRIPLSMFNRHGLVAGATGTGKTKTLQVLAEQLSAAGVPVFMPDIKGDLTGLAVSGEPNAKIQERARDTGDDWAPATVPVEFLSLNGQGTAIPVRATIDSFGPILLSKVLGLNETQESTLGLIVHWADQRNLPLLDLKDLRAVIMHLTSDEGKEDLRGLGGVSKATAGVILRAVTNLDAQGGDRFFGEPELQVEDLLRVGADGRGIVTLFEASGLQTNPALFSTFLMWLLAELFEQLPEVGDVDKPKLVFLFDEAHLLFADASKAFLQAVQQTVKQSEVLNKQMSEVMGQAMQPWWLTGWAPRGKSDETRGLSIEDQERLIQMLFAMQAQLESIVLRLNEMEDRVASVASDAGTPAPTARRRTRS